MNGKRAIKKSSANYPIKKSIRLVKNKICRIVLKEQIGLLYKFGRILIICLLM